MPAANARLGIPGALYHRWLDRKEALAAARHRVLTGLVKAVFDSSDGIYGHRMVHAKLAATGVEVSVGTVAAIMAENGGAAKRMRLQTHDDPFTPGQGLSISPAGTSPQDTLIPLGPRAPFLATTRKQLPTKLEERQTRVIGKRPVNAFME